MSGGFDFLIRGARIVDGTGDPWRYGDVALSGGRIAAVAPPGRIDAANAREVIDAGELVVSPGFIDIQSHSIVPLMRDGRCLSKITQGVTTEIMGEVWTPAPFGGRIRDPFEGALVSEPPREWLHQAREWRRFRDWLDAMLDWGVSPNIGSFLGGGTLRQYGRAMEMGPANAAELETMRRVVAEAMEDGAFGVSYALIYPPEAYVDTAEIIELCKVASRYGGLYITHLRSEGDRFLEALEEALTIGQQAELPVEVYHLKATGTENWPKMTRAIERITAARAGGIDAAADMYPYVASGTGLSAILPAWVSADGKLFDNLRDPAIRARIRENMGRPIGADGAPAMRRDPADIMPVGFQLPEHNGYVGQRLDQIAEARGQDWIDAALDLLALEGQRISTMYFSMSEDNLKLQLRQPWIKIASDAGGIDPAWAAYGPTHPRAYGTFPRVLGHYARDEAVISLEEAVRKMSGAVAARLGLHDRGLLRPGLAADVVLFDPQAINDRATFADSHQLSVGVRDVWVNGVRVLCAGEHTGAKPGQIVSGAGRR
ncbi:MAG TPA: D-aminoacylase [Thermomicrobiales bacterium]